MFTTVFSLALLSTFAIRGVRSEFTIDTPEITQCQDVHIVWSDGKGPYNLLVVPSEDPCNGVLADLGDHDGTSMTWKANLAAGTQLQLSLEDANGDEAWSGTIKVAPSDDASCLPAAASSSSSVSASASTSAASSSAPASSSLAPVVNPENAPATGLTVSPDFTTSASSAAPSSTDGAVAVGAANQGILGGVASGASTVQFSAAAMGFTVLAAVFAIGI